jgi:8-oxoguanine deaminase
MGSIWIKSPLAILAENADGGIVVTDGVISELVGTAHRPIVDEVFDASEHVVIPGLINTHHHFYQTLTRAYGPALNMELFDWLKALYPVWAKLTPEMLSVATELALTELLMSGCTTSTDHHYVFPGGLENGIDIQVEAAKKVGIRSVLTRGSMDLSVKNGGLPPESVVQEVDAILADSERVIDAYHDDCEGAFLQIALAPCSPFSVSRDVMVGTAALAREKRVLLHTHLGETEDENTFCNETLGMRPLDYLDDCGWLDNKVWLAHGIHFSGDEMTRMAEAGVGVSSCPHSNMTLASGICPACDMDKKGISVGVGVDGSASNDASNMIEEVRQMLMIQRLRYGAGSVSHLDALRWASEGSAGCIGRTDIGKIEVGRRADLALFKLNELRHSGHHDPLAALVLCGHHKADYVMVDGKWRVEGGVVPGLDPADLMVRHSNAAKSLAGLVAG